MTGEVLLSPEPEAEEPEGVWANERVGMKEDEGAYCWLDRGLGSMREAIGGWRRYAAEGGRRSVMTAEVA